MHVTIFNNYIFYYYDKAIMFEFLVKSFTRKMKGKREFILKISHYNVVT